ncbi:DUF397 domain-containing protein [Streptomyces sp. NPDC051913]|uniref:DUF397 domain-containing protein n=1 Tax=Streptomyces sp. NPDC051913 TaxID=3365676 RepID=UPI0037CF1D8D
MGTNQDLTGAPWRKSSYSGTSGECVEMAPFPTHIAIRDSKTPSLPPLRVTPATFTAFLNSLR